MAIVWKMCSIIFALSATSHGSKAQNVFCNFDSNNGCGFSKSKSSIINWQRTTTFDLFLSGINDPPFGDHTSGKGHFMHVMRNSNHGNEGILETQLMTPWEAHRQDYFVLEFYYLMNVKKNLDCELRIYVNNIRFDNNTDYSWRRSCTNRQNGWQKATIILHSKTMFQIVFEAKFRGNAQLAIDDVTLIYDGLNADDNAFPLHPVSVSTPGESIVSIIALTIGLINMLCVGCAVAFVIYTKRKGKLIRLFEIGEDSMYTSLRREHSPSVTCVTYEVPVEKMKESDYSFDIPAMHAMTRADSGLTEDQDSTECIGSSNYLNLVHSNEYIYQVVRNNSTDLASHSTLPGGRQK